MNPERKDMDVKKNYYLKQAKYYAEQSRANRILNRFAVSAQYAACMEQCERMALANGATPIELEIALS